MCKYCVIILYKRIINFSSNFDNLFLLNFLENEQMLPKFWFMSSIQGILRRFEYVKHFVLT
jgi:hypothetical protein